MYFSRFAADVEIVVRRHSLADTMSRYRIGQIAPTPNIRLRPRREGAVGNVSIATGANLSIRIKRVL